MPKPLVAIENWAVVQSVISETFKELRPGTRLRGYVIGHATLPNTKLVYTSPILNIDLSEGVVETHNTLYQLGHASDDYKSWERRTISAA